MLFEASRIVVPSRRLVLSVIHPLVAVSCLSETLQGEALQRLVNRAMFLGAYFLLELGDVDVIVALH